MSYNSEESFYRKRLSVARAKATRSANNQNWSDYMMACADIGRLQRTRGEHQVAVIKFMTALVYSLQGAVNYGRYNYLNSPYEPEYAKPYRHAAEQLADAVHGVAELRSIYDQFVEDAWRHDFPRSKDEVWADVETEVIQGKVTNSRLVLKKPDEYVYPENISRGGNGFPTEAGLDESNCQLGTEGHPLSRREKWISSTQSRCGSALYTWIRGNFDLKRLDNQILALAQEHGVFVETYFHNLIRADVKRKVEREDLRKMNELIGECLEIDLSDLKTHQHALVAESVYDLVFLRNEAEVSKIAGDWYRKYSEHSTCEICDRRFRVVDLPHWLYLGSDALKTCCFACPIKENPSKSELEERVPDFVATCGFIPKSNASPRTYSFTSRFSDDKKIDVFKSFARMGGMVKVEQEYGSWFKALAETSALPDGFRYSGTGVWCLAEDGHKCHSLAEQQIDNWLYNHGIDHEREPNYPQHEDYNPSGRRKADWLVENNTLIEYFGLAGDDDYDEKTEEKIALARETETPLIALYPHDLNNLKAKLGQLI
jgi:hypothetical protein